MWRQGCHFPAKEISAFSAALCLFRLPPNQTLKLKMTRKNPPPIKMSKEKNYWLLKTEPGEWSWEDQAANGGLSNWDGVKNKQAQNNMKSMRAGDLCFFYHSGNKARCVVGVVTVVREWYGDDSGGGAVDVQAVGEMRRRVDLAEMKREKGIDKAFGLFRQPRLSVVAVEKSVWEKVCEMGGGFEGDGGACDDEDEKSAV